MRVMNRITDGIRYASILAAARHRRIPGHHPPDRRPCDPPLGHPQPRARGPPPGPPRADARRRGGAGNGPGEGGRAPAEVLRHSESDETTTEVAAGPAWLDQAVRRYDSQRLSA